MGKRLILIGAVFVIAFAGLFYIKFFPKLSFGHRVKEPVAKVVNTNDYGLEAIDFTVINNEISKIS